jgi:hypothetical protein
MCVVAGTQAEQTNPGRNDTMDEVVVMRWEGLSKVRKGDAGGCFSSALSQCSDKREVRETKPVVPYS